MQRASHLYQPSTKLQHRGNTYSQLTSRQQSNIHPKLALQCHSLETLGREGVILDVGQLPEDIVKKQGLCITDFEATPNTNPAVEKRKAIAIACQVADAEDGGSEPVSICAIDFSTGQTLIDSFVAPSRAISDWRTNVHGISARSIEVSLKGHNCLQSWREARAKLFEYVDDRTILVGYEVRSDLEALRVFHRGIVDAQILAMEAIFTANKAPRDKWPIDKVCMGLVSMPIRQHAATKNRIHDPLEDALAAREIVLHFIQKPAEVAKWVKRERLELFGEVVNEEESVEKTAKGRASKKNTNRKSSSSANQSANQEPKRNSNRRRKRPAGATVPIAQSLNEMSIKDAVQGLNQIEGQKGLETAVSGTSHVKDLLENQEKSSDKARRRAAKKANEGAQKGTQEESKRETGLKMMVQEEEKNLRKLENTKKKRKGILAGKAQGRSKGEVGRGSSR